jgi:hypothetical protein
VVVVLESNGCHGKPADPRSMVTVPAPGIACRRYGSSARPDPAS